MPTKWTPPEQRADQGRFGEVWARVSMLLGGLVLLKLALIVELRQHFVQTHWRTESFTAGSLDYFAFGLFIVLIVGSILLLSRHCEQSGPRVSRWANIAVLSLSLVFIFLTFHEGKINYLYPVIDGVLGFGDLGSYLTLDLFFRPPYLAVWLVSYALVYWCVVRSGRERLILRFTAIFTGVYALLHLRELPLLQAASADLLIVDAFGLASLAGLWRARRPLALGWAAVIFGGWIGIFWCILATTSSDLAQPVAYFVSFTAFVLAIMLGSTLAASRGGFLHAWSWLAPFIFTTLLLLGNNHYPTATNLNQILDLAISAPRYLNGEFLLVGLALLFGLALRRWHPKGSLFLLDLGCVGLLLLAFVDLRLTQIMGVRLDWDVISFGHSPTLMLRMAKEYLPKTALAVAGGCAIYAGGVRLLRNRLRSIDPAVRSLTGGSWPFVVTAVVLLAGIGWLRVKPDKALGQSVIKVAASSPAMRRISQKTMSDKEFQDEARSLGMTWGASVTRADERSSSEQLNVVFILLESTYNKHLSLFGSEHDTQPLLSRYRDRMEVFPNFFANFMGSIHARFACFTGLYPVRDYYSFTLERVPVKSMFEVMKGQGYQCSMFYSSYLDYTCFRDFLAGRELDEMYDADTMPGTADAERFAWGLPEGDTLGAIKGKIGQYAAQQDPFFLTYIPACPHYPYDSVPPEFLQYEMEEDGDFTPLYRNSLLYMDWIVTSIVEELEEQRLLDRTLIVITGDHGEMLGDQGGNIGHGWAVTPELSNVPLILIKPGQDGFEVNPTIGSHVDLLPTIADLTGVPLPVAELYQGRSLYLPLSEGRSIYINSHAQFGVVRGDLLTIGDRATSSASNSEFESWHITNDGPFTRFELVSIAEPKPPDIGAFDLFQSGLLSQYRRFKAYPAPEMISRNKATAERLKQESLKLADPLSMAKRLEQ